MARGKKPDAKPARKAIKGRTPRTKRAPKEDPVAKAKAAFIAELMKGTSITGAANVAGIGRRTAYQWRDADPVFSEAWDDAIEAGTDILEDEAHRRAHRGVTRETSIGSGPRQKFVEITEYSDTLAIFLLKARRPDKYRDNVKVDHGGKLDVNVVAGAKDTLGAKLAKLTKPTG